MNLHLLAISAELVFSNLASFYEDKTVISVLEMTDPGIKFTTSRSGED